MTFKRMNKRKKTGACRFTLWRQKFQNQFLDAFFFHTSARKQWKLSFKMSSLLGREHVSFSVTKTVFLWRQNTTTFLQICVYTELKSSFRDLWVISFLKSTPESSLGEEGVWSGPQEVRSIALTVGFSVNRVLFVFGLAFNQMWSCVQINPITRCP